MGSLDAIRQQLKGRIPGKKQGGSLNFYRFPSGMEEVKIRILPPWEGSDFPVKLMRRHYKLPGADKSVICPSTFGQDCEICEVIQHFDGRLDLSQWAAATQCVGNCIVRKDPTQPAVKSNEVYIFTGSEGLMKWLVDLYEDGEGKVLVDPFEGRDLRMKREKSNGKFIITPGFSATPLAESPDATEGYLSKLPNLDKVWSAQDDSELAKIREYASNLKEVVESRLLNLSADSESAYDADDMEVPFSGDPVPPKKEELKKEEPKKSTLTKETAPKTVATKAEPTSPVKPKAQKTDKPSGAPECFSDESVYNRDSDKCFKCNYEYHCGVALGKVTD